MFGGRRSLRMVFDYVRADEEAGPPYDIGDLMAISFRGDNEFEYFLDSWDHVLAGMYEDPPEETLRVHFNRQVGNSNVIKFDLEVYNRSNLGG